jgi:GNAT superfamily N-acetyltransferase
MGAFMEQHGIEIRVVDDYSALDRLALSGGDSDPGRMNSFGLAWQPKTHHLLVLKGGTPVAHIGFLLCLVTVEDGPIPVAGIGSVLTRLDCRGQGFARLGMEAAEDAIRQQQMAQFGMLFCREQMRSWYERLGWTQVAVPVWFDQPGGATQSPLPVLVKCFGRDGWPPGTVRLGCFPW